MKQLLKSVHIYRNYRQIKPGGPFFLEHPVGSAASAMRRSFAVVMIADIAGGIVHCARSARIARRYERTFSVESVF